jgi:hypothetical protein
VDLESKIKVLLDENTHIDKQIEIISELNKSMFEADSLYALVSSMLEHADLVTDIGETAVDLVGTGGDGFKTINFSTIGTLVASGAGVSMAKHGNRSVTSKCGGFDLLEQKLTKAAEFYLLKHRLNGKIPCRFDLIAIDNSTSPIEWLKNIF